MTTRHLLTVHQHIRDRFGPEAEAKFLAGLSPYERDWLLRQEEASAEDELPSTLLFDRPWLLREVDAPISLPTVGEDVRRTASMPPEVCAHCRAPINGVPTARVFLAPFCSQECLAALWGQLSNAVKAIGDAFNEAIAPLLDWGQALNGIILAGLSDGDGSAPPISKRRAGRPAPPRYLGPQRYGSHKVRR